MRAYAFATVACMATLASADTLAAWNFNTDDGSTGTGTLAASQGAGTLSAVGGATAFFGGSFGSSDPADFPLDSAWSVGGYPDQGTASGTVGWSAMVSTLGYQSIQVSFDLRNQPSSNKWFRLDTTTDGGGSWVEGQSYGIADSDVWYNQATFDLSGAAGVNNNAQFGVRFVAVFKPGENFYEASEAGYNGDFGVLYDMVQVSGEPVPEPATLVALGGALIMLRRHKRS